MIDAALAVVSGLWGAGTLALLAYVAKLNLDLVAQRSRNEVAIYREQLAEKKLSEYTTVLKQILERPAQAIFTDEQKADLARELEYRIKEIRKDKVFN